MGGFNVTDIKLLVIDFERFAAKYQRRGIDKTTAERLAMEMALQTQGWTYKDAVEMTENIFRPRRDQPSSRETTS